MTEIRHNGTIVAIDGKSITLKINPHDDCENCALKDACGKTSQEKNAVIECDNPQDYKIGQNLEVIISGGQLSGIALFGYILPLIVMLAVLFAVGAAIEDETCAAVAALLSVPVYYGVLRCFGGKLRKILKIRVQ